MSVLQLASIALSYPDQEILDVREEFVHVVEELPDSTSRTWLPAVCRLVGNRAAKRPRAPLR